MDIEIQRAIVITERAINTIQQISCRLTLELNFNVKFHRQSLRQREYKTQRYEIKYARPW